jgi:prepilin-type N-terminal cleavage/methylation domain-containing protein
MIQSFLKRHRKFQFLSHQARADGFTLIELLVAMVVASLISAGLLFVVVQLVQTNLREAARSDTQRDLQSAIDSSARDVREAVFVYDANCLLDKAATTNACPGLRNYLPTNITGTDTFGTSNNVPVLAFWRVDRLPNELQTACKNNAIAYSKSAPLPTAIAGVPCLSGRMYTLVVYSLNKAPGAVSSGRARIMRYELPQFTSSSVQPSKAPTLTQGWVDPKGKTSAGKETGFLAWPVSRASLTEGPLDPLQEGGRPTNANNLPLTDFVDWNGLYDPSGSTVSKGRAPGGTADLVLTPKNGATAADDPPRGFYVYVRGGDREGDLNQEVVIRIQGDAAGRPGIPNVAAVRPVVPISLETRVLTRGVTNKTQ